jgi:hypothetical protein
MGEVTRIVEPPVILQSTPSRTRPKQTKGPFFFGGGTRLSHVGGMTERPSGTSTAIALSDEIAESYDKEKGSP